jgi:putative ABC transport system permease protein
MIKNFFKISLRIIKRYPLYTILNISGMAIGMACAILMLLWIQNELSYDRFYKNADRLYRVVQTFTYEGRSQLSAATPYPLASALKEEFPEIIRSTRYQNAGATFTKGDNIVEGGLAFVDNDFFEMFDIEFVQGDKTSALDEPYNIIITEKMAKRYFGGEDPLGKTMTVWPNYLLKVTGVIKNTPLNSHFTIDCISTFAFCNVKYLGNSNPEVFNEWTNVFNYTFIELLKEANSKTVEAKIKDIIQKKANGQNAEIFLQNVKNIHLYSNGRYAYDIESGNILYVRLMSLLAFLILTIACINFMNLTTAQSFRRAKEIGVRKMAGANRRKIVFQFLGETLLIVFIAHLIAMILVELFFPSFNSFLFSRLELNYKSAGLYVVLITVILFCGLSAGSYPAFHLSSLKPTNILKGTIDKDLGNIKFRKILVILQFSLSFLFIISTLIIRSQLNYMRNEQCTSNMDNLVHFEFTNGIQRETLKDALCRNPDILSVTITDHQNVLNNWTSVKGIDWKGKKEGDDVLFSVLNTDKDYAKTFQLELTKGSFLSTNDFSIDKAVVVINEKAAEIMGFSDPIGETITYNGINFKIMGVVKNFHFKTLHAAIEPLIIVPIPSTSIGGICYVKMKPDHITSTLSEIRKICKSNNMDYTLEFRFLDDDYASTYWLEQKAGILLGYLTILAIIISCLGLIGLSTFMTVHRTKEIGIRKANGAKPIEIISLLSKEYLKLVAISFTIAAPIAWYATNIWLRGFAYRINTGWRFFALAIIIVIMIITLTVGIQSYNAARKRPVDALRYE